MIVKNSSTRYLSIQHCWFCPESFSRFLSPLVFRKMSPLPFSCFALKLKTATKKKIQRPSFRQQKILLYKVSISIIHSSSLPPPIGRLSQQGCKKKDQLPNHLVFISIAYFLQTYMEVDHLHVFALMFFLGVNCTDHIYCCVSKPVFPLSSLPFPTV